MNETIVSFMQRFHGRTDRYGTWDGGSAVCDGDEWYDHYHRHLAFGPYIGVYPSIDNTNCAWGCVDIDGTKGAPEWEELWETANRLAAALAYKRVKGWTEQTANGIHVWVFPDTPSVPARTMRRALLAACEVIGYRPKEVNPKQELLEDGRIGNYVRLPYYGYFADGMPHDRYIVEEGEAMDLEEFLLLSDHSLVSTATLEDMARLWVPPETATIDLEGDINAAVNNLVPMLPSLAYKIWTEGHLGTDRSHAMVKFCLELRNDQWQPAYTLKMLRALDGKLGKFVDRHDREEQLNKIVRFVYE